MSSLCGSPIFQMGQSGHTEPRPTSSSYRFQMGSGGPYGKQRQTHARPAPAPPTMTVTPPPTTTVTSPLSKTVTTPPPKTAATLPPSKTVTSPPTTTVNTASMKAQVSSPSPITQLRQAYADLDHPRLAAILGRIKQAQVLLEFLYEVFGDEGTSRRMSLHQESELYFVWARASWLLDGSTSEAETLERLHLKLRSTDVGSGSFVRTAILMGGFCG